MRIDAGLLDWLLANAGGSRTKLKATLAGRGVKVNGKVVTRHDFPLRPGMTVEVSRSKKTDTTLSNHWVRLAYEDRWLMVVEKRDGILSMAAGHSTLNVKAVLDDYLRHTRQPCNAHVVHRLDRETSGLMVYAKSRDVAMAMQEDWHHTVYDRRYIGVLSGIMEDDEGSIANWLRDSKAFITYSSPVDNGGKYAVTHYHTLDRHDDHSLVEFRLETGRKNQIRVHAADMGHPVCGDAKYGNGDDPIGRLCLHAFRLCFTHPVTGKSMEFETPFPPSFTKLF